MGLANNVIECYGISSFIDDIDHGREYWRDGNTIVVAVLEYLAGPGFAKLFEDVELDHTSSALEFRQRHLLRALSGNGQ